MFQGYGTAQENNQIMPPQRNQHARKAIPSSIYFSPPAPGRTSRFEGFENPVLNGNKLNSFKKELDAKNQELKFY